MAGLSAQHIAPSSGGFEPQRSYDFQLELYGVPGSELIQLAIAEVTFPMGRSEPISIEYFAESRKVAGRLNFSDSRFSCHDYVDENVAGVLMAWRALIIDIPSGVQGYAPQYKREGAVVLMGPDGGRERVMKLTGCWPMSVTVDPLSMRSNDNVMCSVDLAYDTAFPENF